MEKARIRTESNMALRADFDQTQRDAPNPLFREIRVILTAETTDSCDHTVINEPTS
jgi:hypothetical protein